MPGTSLNYWKGWAELENSCSEINSEPSNRQSRYWSHPTKPSFMSEKAKLDWKVWFFMQIFWRVCHCSIVLALLRLPIALRGGDMICFALVQLFWVLLSNWLTDLFYFFFHFLFSVERYLTNWKGKGKRKLSIGPYMRIYTLLTGPDWMDMCNIVGMDGRASPPPPWSRCPWK